MHLICLLESQVPLWHAGSCLGAGRSTGHTGRDWEVLPTTCQRWHRRSIAGAQPGESSRPAGMGRPIQTVGSLLSGLQQDSARPGPTRSPWEAGLGSGRGLAPGNALSCCARCPTDHFLLLPARAQSVPGSSPGPPASRCWCDQTCQARSGAGSWSHKPKLNRKPKPNRYKELKVMAQGRRLWGARSTGRHPRPHPQRHSGASPGATGSAPGPGRAAQAGEEVGCPGS